jgi:hypothetical protein
MCLKIQLKQCRLYCTALHTQACQVITTVSKDHFTVIQSYVLFIVDLLFIRFTQLL